MFNSKELVTLIAVAMLVLGADYKSAVWLYPSRG